MFAARSQAEQGIRLLDEQGEMTVRSDRPVREQPVENRERRRRRRGGRGIDIPGPPLSRGMVVASPEEVERRDPTTQGGSLEQGGSVGRSIESDRRGPLDALNNG